MRAIISFQREWFFLNNYFPAETEFDGMTYSSVEHAYQAAKTLDLETRREIAATVDPDEAKRIGRASEHRPDWEQYKLSLMWELVTAKFQDAELASRLLGTGSRTLIEGNDWGDTFWGMCDGIGDNHMGEILMNIRSSLARQQRVAS